MSERDSFPPLDLSSSLSDMAPPIERSLDDVYPETGVETRPAPAPPPPEPAGEPSAVLAGALLFGTAGAVVPAVVTVWLVFAMLATGVVAEALEQTGGLVPTTFGGGFWLALGVDVAVTGWSLVLAARAHRAAFRPLLVAVAALAAAGWVAVPLDLAGVDVPDIATAFVLLAAHHLALYVLPVALVVVTTRAVTAAWVAGQRSRRSGRRVAVNSACLGGVGVSVIVGLGLIGDGGYTDPMVTAAEQLATVATSGVDTRRRLMADVGAETGAPPPARYVASPTEVDAFVACAEAVARARVDDAPLLSRATGILVRAGLAGADARDLVTDAMLGVCTRAASDDEDGLATALIGALTRHPAARCRLPRGEWSGGDTPGLACELVDAEPIDDVRRAYRRLEPADQLLVELRYARGASYRDIADRFRVREPGAQRRAARALGQLRRAWSAARE